VTGVYSETSYRKLDNEYIYMTIEWGYYFI
jgi:hypothetical protein